MKSPDQPNEEMPLQPPSTAVKPDNSGETKGWFLSKTKLIILVVLFIILVIIIIVLAVLYGVATAAKRQELEKHDENATEREPSTTMTTSIPILPTTPGTEAWWNPRLRTNIIPKHYNLFLNITVDLPRFDGRVGIDIEVNNKTDLIILHNNGLNISALQVISKKTNGMMKVRHHFPFPKYTYHVIQMSSELQEGPYLLKMTFQGFFRDTVAGMFRKSFTRPNEQKAFFAGTQFQETHARKVFPCFDEPALKATFNVSIAHRSDYVALCNMPIYKTETTDGQKIDYYGKTVTMPTYLLAFVVGDFKYVETMSRNNITMRIYSRPSYINKTEYASSVGGKILSFFEDYLEVPYSLPKEDQIALPGFGAGGMENWGLIIYGEGVLLWDPNESTEALKLRITSLMSHEIAHQFFGNIVTCKWWDNLWLNEAFASYIGDVGITSVIPSWKMDDGVASKLTSVLQTDAQMSPHPIKLDADTEPGHYWASIIYTKGSLVIRMLEGFLGNDTFLEGLKIYLKRHAFGNVESDDLWRAMTEASCARGQCIDVKQIMDTWILQAGYPVLTLEKINSTHYQVNQRRFLLDKKANRTASAAKSPFGDLWVVPLPYAIKNQSHQFTWMNKSSSVIEWDGKDWIKLNLGHKGFFIVNYEEENWKALALQLKQQHTIFSASDRTGLLVDSSLLAIDNKLNLSTLIEMTEFMEKETELGTWEVLFEIRSYLLGKLPTRSNAYKYLMKYMTFLGKHQYESVGFNDGGNTIDKLKRSYFLPLFCGVGEKTCIGNATKYFKAWMKDPTSNSIPPNLRDVVYYHGVGQGGVEEWNFLYSQYNQTKNPSKKTTILLGLSATRNPWMIDRYLSYALDQGKFESRHLFYVFYYVRAFNPIGRYLVWNYIRANWNRISKRFDNNSGTAYYSLVSSLTKGFNTLYSLNEVQRFQAQVNVVDESALKAIKERIQWVEKNEKEIEHALEKLLKKNNQM